MINKTIDRTKMEKAIEDSVAQLIKSERGMQVLRDVRSLFRNGAYGLDSRNMVALCVLVEAVRVGFTDTVDEAISEVIP